MTGKRKKINILIPFKSIRTSMIFWFLLLIVTTLIIFSATSLNYTENTVMETSIDYTTRLVSQINRDIDSYINYMENISSLVVNSGDVSEYLFSAAEETEKEQLYNRIITQFNTVVETREDISNIGVVTKEKQYIINGGDDQLNENILLKDVDWYTRAMETGESVLTASHVQHVIQNNYKWVVTLSKGIVNPETGKNGAVFFIDLNYKLLKDLCENNSLANNSYVFIVDETGKIIYHPKQQLLYSGLKTEKIEQVLACDSSYFIINEGDAAKLYTVVVSEKTGWRVVGVADFSELMKSQKEAQNLYFFTAIVIFLTAILLSTMLAAAITRPVKQLMDSMKEVERGNFEKANVDVWQGNEIGSLGNSFNIMTEKIRQLMEQNTAVQEQKRRSELQALRSQINPHFLYNTLDSIIWMAEGEKNKEVVLMTAALARLLRQSISNDNERIPLEKEIEHTRSYLTIQQMRYKDKLEYEIDVAPDIQKEMVINLILQPLVENAIYHGIKYKGSKGKITIRGVGEEQWIILQVSDDGNGMDEETLANIMDKSKAKEGTGGVGVYNVHTRLQLYYGEAYGLHFESAPGEGTTVTVTIPRNFREEKGNEEA